MFFSRANIKHRQVVVKLRILVQDGLFSRDVGMGISVNDEIKKQLKKYFLKNFI